MAAWCARDPFLNGFLQLWKSYVAALQSFMLMFVIVNCYAQKSAVLAYTQSSNAANSLATFPSPLSPSATPSQNVSSTAPAEVAILRNITLKVWRNIDTTNTDPCQSQWPGVSCHFTGKDFQHITDLHLEDEPVFYSSNFLSSIAKLKYLRNLEASAPSSGIGQGRVVGDYLPSDLGSLQHLLKLDLSGSMQLQGSIPSELGKLTNLQYLNLRQNNLSGAIPQAICQLQSLRILDLGKNELNGGIPTCIGNLTNLTHLALDANQLEGSIPSTIGQLSLLTDLNLEKNQLTGEIPDTLTNLLFLNYLSLANNLLSGPLPAEIGKLRSLQVLDINFNTNISGSIPPSIGNVSGLVELKLYAANLSGTIPDEIGYLSNLTDLLLQSNRLEGSIPASLKNLKRLKNLQLQGNQLSGSLPEDIFINLINLQFLSLEGNNFSGEIPLELTNLTSLTMLSMSSNMLSGSLPAELGHLSNLQALLLCCNLFSGPIPSELGNLQKLKLLDLSQNLLTGSIPENFNALLHGNLSNIQLDFSFNRLNGIGVEAAEDSFVASNCHSSTSASLTADDGGCGGSCGSRGIECCAINAGGPPYRAFTTSGPILFEEDMSHNSSVVFYTSPPCSSWALSVSGLYGAGILSTQERVSFSEPNSPPAGRGEIPPFSSWPLYSTARTGADSMTYYGNCLKNGNYVIELHFAEIQLQSPGERIFDIIIQGQLAHEHLDVVSLAGGPLKPLVMIFHAIVAQNVLSIKLKGRGSWSDDPNEGLTPYNGPTISAIRVFPFSKSKSSRAYVWAILGGGIGVLVLIGVLLGVGFYWRRFRARRAPKVEEHASSRIGLIPFEYEELEVATSKFSKENLLGEGAYGRVYKGCLTDGRHVAIKQLINYTQTCKVWFYHELQVISSVRHRNLVPLIGCCVDRGFPLLVCEYMPNGNLQNALFRKDHLVLSWESRFRIAVDVARGLLYLHEDSPTRIVHRDVKPANILLDKNMNAYISDFGLAELMNEKEDEIVVTSVMGTRGYLAPEYVMHGQLSEKVDVYSYGIVLLEMVTGRRGMQTSTENKQEAVTMDTWVWEVLKNGKVQELADTRFSNKCPHNELLNMVKIALWCTQSLPSLRPSMGQVLLMLVGQVGVPELPSERTSFGDEFKDIPSPHWPSFATSFHTVIWETLPNIEGGMEEDHLASDDPTTQMLTASEPSTKAFSISL